MHGDGGVVVEATLEPAADDRQPIDRVPELVGSPRLICLLALPVPIAHVVLPEIGGMPSHTRQLRQPEAGSLAEGSAGRPLPYAPRRQGLLVSTLFPASSGLPVNVSSGQVAGAFEPSRPLSVLLADDEPMIVRLLQRLLEGRGHTVRTASSAHQALSMLKAHQFDAALVDVRMPGGGLTVLEHLQADPSFSGMVVLMTGALATDPDLQLGPGVMRLQKPFNNRELIELLEAYGNH